MLSMFGIVRDSSAMSDPDPSPTPPKRVAVRKPMPYEQPSADGKCHFLELPDEVKLDIFLRLGLPELTKCFRLCKPVYSFMSESAAVNLRHTLLANSLRANPLATVANPDVPEQMPLSSSQMLAALRERLTRFHNFTPKAQSKIEFQERSGSLYEYIEGVLLRTGRSRYSSLSQRSRKLIVYDLRKTDDWEDEEGDNVEIEEGDDVLETTGEAHITDDVRSEHTFQFEIMELAVDPGQDLLVLVSLSREDGPGSPWSMYIHLLSLTTYEPHPLAKEPMLKYPVAMPRRKVHLDFQILDDMIHVMSRGMIDGDEKIPEHLIGWQWTTGRLHVMLKARPMTMTFQSFVMLTPWSYIIPTVVARISPDSELNGDIENFDDLYWTLQLQLYAFPPLSDNTSEPPHVATHVATVDMPRMTASVRLNLSPMNMSIRTDPPPRLTFPKYPLHAPPPFLPDPESGIVIIDLAYNHFIAHPRIPVDTRFTVIMLKSTLARYLPAPTSPLLTKPWSRPVPVIPWETIAPESRVFGPNCLGMNWVCYVYQNRYVRPVVTAIEEGGEDENGEFDIITAVNLQLLDFDQNRARKERCERMNRANVQDSEDTENIEGDLDGINLVLSETVTPALEPLTGPIRSGSKLPYIFVERETTDTCPMIDSERILLVRKRGFMGSDSDSDSDADSEGGLDVMEF